MMMLFYSHKIIYYDMVSIYLCKGTAFTFFLKYYCNKFSSPKLLFLFLLGKIEIIIYI